MNTLLHKHLFTHVSTELVSELEIPAFTVLDNQANPASSGLNLLNVKTAYVYTLADIDNPPKHTLQFNTTDMSYITVEFEEPVKLVPIYEMKIKCNVEITHHVSFDLVPIKVIQMEDDEYRPLRNLEHLLAVEFERAIRCPIVRIYNKDGHIKAYLMIEYSDAGKEDMMRSLIESEQFKKVVIEYSPSKELHTTYGLNCAIGIPSYMAQVELDYNKIVEKYNIRTVE